MEQPPKSFLRDQSEYLLRQLKSLFASIDAIKSLLDKALSVLPYDISLFIADTPYIANSLLGGFVTTRAIKLDSLAGSRAKCKTAPISNAVSFIFKVDNVTIATVSFQVGAVNGVFAEVVSMPYTIPAGALVLVYADNIVDAAISGIGLTLTGSLPTPASGTLKSLQYDIGFFVADTPYDVNLLLCGFLTSKDFKLTSLAGSKAKCKTAPILTDTSFYIKVDGITVITVTFLVGSFIGTFTANVPLTLNIANNALVTFHSSAAVDTAISGVGVTLIGTLI